MAAILMLVLALLKSGDHVVCSQSVFGSTIQLFAGFREVRRRDHLRLAEPTSTAWRDAMRPNTKLLFAETPTNPLTEVCDIAALADIAHARGALLVVDNCFCSPALQRPVELGADIVMHSGTKYLDGQGRVIAGALCASTELSTRSSSPVMRSAGMTLSPFNAWVVLKGLETLSIRMQAQSARALALARWLETQPKVERVYYPGLGVAPAARAGDGAAGRGRRRGGLVRRARRRGAARASPSSTRRSVCSITDQPRRHEDHDHPSGEHLARPPHRGRSAPRPASRKG